MPNLNGRFIMSNYIPIFDVDAITYPCPNLDAGLATLLAKRPLRPSLALGAPSLAHWHTNIPVTSISYYVQDICEYIESWSFLQN